MGATFKKIEACIYEYAESGYFVEQMENGLWDAYLPSRYGYRLWQSTKHSTRAMAAMAISMERRKIARDVRSALKPQTASEN